MDACDDFLGQRILFPQGHQGAHAAFQLVEVIGDEGGQDGIATVFAEAVASVVQGFGGEAIAVKVGTCVAIDLGIERFHEREVG